MESEQNFLLDVILPKVQALQIEVFKMGTHHFHVDGGTYFSGRVSYDVAIFDDSPSIVFKADFSSSDSEDELGETYNKLYEFVKHKM